MANLGTLFDASQVNPESQFDPIPSGEYVAMIIDSDMKSTSNRRGQYLELTHQILEGPYTGRQVWARLNLVNDNAKTVEIAQQHLSAVCHAAGVLRVNDSQQLHNIPLVIRVEFVKADPPDFVPPQGKRRRERDTNEVRAWKRIEGQTTAQAQPAGAPPFARPQTPAAPATGVAPPSWAKPAA